MKLTYEQRWGHARTRHAHKKASTLVRRLAKKERLQKEKDAK